jgi:hypothetical protein
VELKTVKWTKPLLMLTMPNSGSTWFARLLAERLPGCRYYDKEFFNPVCNLKHELTLRRNFGSELVSCYRNIASPGDSYIDDDIVLTWGAENYNFTKECQSGFKLDAFLRHFRVFVFLRPEEESFPPNRARVWSFYEHAWHSLQYHGYMLKAETTFDRALEAYRIIYAHIVSGAKRRGVPTIYYSDLFDEREVVRERLERAIGYSGDDLVDAAIATRVRSSRTTACTLVDVGLRYAPLSGSPERDPLPRGGRLAPW